MVQPEALSLRRGLVGHVGSFQVPKRCDRRLCGHFINRRRVVVKRDDPAVRRCHQAEYRGALRRLHAAAGKRAGAGAEAGRGRDRAGRGRRGGWRDRAAADAARGGPARPPRPMGAAGRTLRRRRDRRSRRRCASCAKNSGSNSGRSDVLGLLDDYPTRSGYLITPVVVWAEGSGSISPNPDEVASVHRIALDDIERPDAFDFAAIPESDAPRDPVSPRRPVHPRADGGADLPVSRGAGGTRYPRRGTGTAGVRLEVGRRHSERRRTNRSVQFREAAPPERRVACRPALSIDHAVSNARTIISREAFHKCASGRSCFAPRVRLVLAGALDARAQHFPNRTITLVIPFAPGGSTSIVGRVIADQDEPVARPEHCDRQPSAAPAARSAPSAVAKSDPDGYTILLGYTGTLAIGPSLYKNAGYDPRKSFAPIGLIGNAPSVLAVHPSFPRQLRRRTDRLCQGQSRQGQFRLRGRRVGQPYHRRIFRPVRPASRWCTFPTRAPDRR